MKLWPGLDRGQERRLQTFRDHTAAASARAESKNFWINKAAATLTFKLSMSPTSGLAFGIPTTPSTRLCMKLRTPVSSLPRTRTQGYFNKAPSGFNGPTLLDFRVLWLFQSPAASGASAAKNFQPFSREALINSPSVLTCRIGYYSSAPAEAFRALVLPAAEAVPCSGMSMASTPRNQAERTIAPKFPVSVMRSSNSMNG